MWIPAFPNAVLQIMLQRINAGCGDIAVLLQVPSGAEKRARIAALARPACQIMLQRSDAFGGHVWVAREIPRSVKKRVGIAILVNTPPEIVGQRVDVCGRNIGVLAKVPGSVEEDSRSVLPRRLRCTSPSPGEGDPGRRCATNRI